MNTKITRDNYREQLEIIAEQNGLGVVNTTEGRNGYPMGIMPMLIGFDSFEQFQEISAQYPILNHFKLEKKDGWQLWYRQSDYFTDAFELDNYINNVNIWYKHEKTEYIYHSLLSTFEVFFSDVYGVENELGITLLDNGINYNDFEISNVRQGLELWERNCAVVEELQNKTWINDEEEEEEDLSTYIDFDSVKENISKYEEYFPWFDNKEPNKMLVENLNNGDIDESDIKVCSFYEDTHTYAMALGVNCLSDLEID